MESDRNKDRERESHYQASQQAPALPIPKNKIQRTLAAAPEASDMVLFSSSSTTTTTTIISSTSTYSSSSSSSVLLFLTAQIS
ncbi:hypothetical protein M0802_006520 [Mischocyttarus mexicanus]|nr:hypothetical protein M0802_006520 [Mischocyttarus mexicanus]